MSILIYGNITKAKEMGLPKEYALRCHQNYLTGQLYDLKDEIAEIMNGTYDTAVEALLMVKYAMDLVGKSNEVEKELRIMKSVGQEDELTEDMKEQARQYPINQLIAFDRTGKALAWCHPDKKPSLSWHKKANRAHCFVCDKSFDPIAVLMDRDGMNFRQAVRCLCRS